MVKFSQFVNESVGSKKYEEFRKLIKKMNSKNYNDLLKQVEKAFHDKVINSQEFDELDAEMFRKMKTNESVKEEPDEEYAEALRKQGIITQSVTKLGDKFKYVFCSDEKSAKKLERVLKKRKSQISYSTAEEGLFFTIEFKGMNEGRYDYEVYHNSYSAAISEVERFAEDNGYTLDDQTDSENIGDQMATKVGLGPKKPRDGETNKFHFELYKNNRQIRKMLHVQIYNRGTSGNEYELNMYIA
jgi:hypothetical protein